MMKLIAFVALLASVSAGGSIVSAPVADPAGTFYTRAPAHDSAIIKSDRLGGNFAYSVAEAHAYAAHTPIVQQVSTPVAVSYKTAAVPAVATYQSAIAPAAAYYPTAPAASYYNAAPYYNPYYNSFPRYY